MKKRYITIALLLIAAVMLMAATAVHADFGGFSGDSDYGGDWGGSDWGDSDWSDGGFFFWGGSDDTRGGSCGGGTTIVIAIVIIIVVIMAIRSKSGGAQTPVVTTVARTDDSELLPMERYVGEVDEGFNSAEMRTRLSNIYVQMQDCWSAKDISPMRPYLTDELYSQSERQLDEIKAKRQTPHIERIAVLGVELRGYYIREGMDHIIAQLSTRITTYTTDDASGEVVRGDPVAEKFMTYEWDIARTSGQKTGDAAPMQAINCPNCGAPLSINKSAQCPYCDTVITLDEHDWVIYQIKGLSQRTSR